jgi:putative ABC transport system permease protein
MVIQTRRGAARLVARQAPVALRPDNPIRMRAIAPPDPHSLRDNVNTDLAGIANRVGIEPRLIRHFGCPTNMGARVSRSHGGRHLC